MSEQTPIAESYWVTPNALLAGEYPRAPVEQAARAKLRKILSAGITCFVDLTEDGEYGLVAYAPQLAAVAAEIGHEVEHHRMPIRDVSVPSRTGMALILDLIDEKISQGHVVYVH